MNSNTQSKRAFFSVSRLFYASFLFLFMSIFTARFACQRLDCSITTFKSWIWENNCEKHCAICKLKAEKSICEECEKCKLLIPEWNIRAAFDEAGLIILGICASFLVLIYKNFNVLFLLKSISKLSLFGTIEWELDKLHDEVSKLENDKYREISLDSIQEVETIQRQILKTSNNPTETLIQLNFFNSFFYF